MGGLDKRGHLDGHGIAVEPVLLRFGPQAKRTFQELHKLLQAQDATHPVSIKRCEELLLDRSGRLPNGYRFTQTSLTDFCAWLAPGLAPLVANLTGQRLRGRAATRVEEPKSRVVAVQAINAIIRLRFDSRLYDRSLILDPRSRTVEGVVGPRYTFYSNLDALKLAEDFRKRFPQARLTSACLQGRRLLLRYADPSQRIGVQRKGQDPQVFFRAWGFSNSETGKSSLRLTEGLLHSGTGGLSLTDSGRARHTQNFSEKKVAQLCDDLAASLEGGARAFRDHIAALMRARLDLGLSSKTAADKKLQTLKVKLRRRLSPPTSRRVINAVLLHGESSHDKLPTSPADDPREISDQLSRRKLFDLYYAIIVTSRTLPFAEQEAAEQLAHRLLIDPTFFQ